MRYRNWIFDLDGTLVDSAPDVIDALQRAMEASNLVPAAIVTSDCIGPPIKEIIKTLAPEASVAAIAKAVSFFRDFYDEAPMSRTLAYPGVIDALEKARASGCNVFIATNKPQKPTFRIIDHLFRGKIDKTACIDTLPGTKLSKAEMISWLLLENSLSGTDTVMVGDGVSDIKGALSTKCYPVGVLYGYGCARDLAAAGCISFVEDSLHLYSTLEDLV